MRLEVKQYGEIHVLILKGKMTIGDGDRELRESFLELLDGGARQLVIDMLPLSYVDSSGLGELVACKKRAAERGARVSVVLEDKGKPHELFKITMLTKVFDVFFTVEEALASYAA